MNLCLINDGEGEGRLIETKRGMKKGIKMDLIRDYEMINRNDTYNDSDGENKYNDDNTEIPLVQCV